ncbi:MAG: T9SS type A sorting domain-containing protein [Candidatus Kapaibacterium sp.]
MKKYITLSIAVFTIVTGAFAQREEWDNERTGEAHRRWMEWAHPTPVGYTEPPLLPWSDHKIPRLLSTEENISSFENVNLIAPEADQLPVQNESSIAVNPKNPKNIIASAVDYRNGSSAWVYVSSDGGKTWKNINLGKPFTGWTAGNDPSVAFANDGTAYLMYGVFGNRSAASPENGVMISRSTDEGKTWKTHIPVILHTGAQTADSSFEDKYYVVVDNSPTSPYYKRLYTPWKRVTARDSATQIVVTHSSDSGNTWSVPVNASARLSGSSEDTTFGQSFPLVITGKNGEVYTIWNYGPKHSIGFSKSMDGGVTFSAPSIIQTYKPLGVARKIPEGVRHTLKGVVRVESYPSMVCDIGTKHPGRLYLAWAADETPNVYFSRSDDGGTTWTTPKIVHSDTTNDQFWAWIAIDRTNGDLAIMYLDSRDDPQNLLSNCYVSYSNDGGDTWIDRRVGDVGSDLRRNPFQGNAFAGDYSGCAFHNGMIYPSWVDMRNATTGTDNDTYTAIVNTRALNPANPFTASTIPQAPTTIQLTWGAPTSRAFGQPLNPSEFTFLLYRGATFLGSLASNVSSYTDTALTPFTKYEYSIKVATSQDTSVARLASAFSGGARQPAGGTLISAKGNADNHVNITIKVPNVRADGITPLVNLSKVAIYRDSVYTGDAQVAQTDTGKIVTITDNPPARGWYRYAIAIKDGSTPENLSDRTGEVLCYTGVITPTFTEQFDAVPLPKYYMSEKWGIASFAKSPTGSLSESPSGQYLGRARDTFMLFPVSKSTGDIAMSFWHAAIVDPTDTAFVEVSRDGGNQWEVLAAYNNSNYAPWKDGALNGQDWKPELLTIKNADTAIVRFRFWSNFTKHDDGWYIDNINIPSVSGVDEQAESKGIIIYPNPAQTMLYVQMPDEYSGARLALYSTLGTAVTPESTTGAFDVSALASGMYSMRIVLSNGDVVWRSVVVGR